MKDAGEDGFEGREEGAKESEDETPHRKVVIAVRAEGSSINLK